MASLKPQDIVVALKLVTGESRGTYSELAESLGLSASQAHGAVTRAGRAGLVDRDRRQANGAALYEFLVHGAKYVFPAERGQITRGVPTAHAAPPLVGMLARSEELPPVWPDPEGYYRGLRCGLRRAVLSALTSRHIRRGYRHPKHKNKFCPL